MIELSLTIDDLPFSEDETFADMRLCTLNNFLSALQKHNITNTYGFINGVGNHLNQYREICDAWLMHGQCLANHTYSHPNLDTVTAKEFIHDISILDKLLKRDYNQINYKYFRYPYLSMGTDPIKYQKVKDYLLNTGYTSAHVTVDTRDYLWANSFNKQLIEKNQLIPEYLKKSFFTHLIHSIQLSEHLASLLFKRPIKHILLVHFKYFTSLILDELIVFLKKNKIEIITLEEAICDDAYQNDPFNAQNCENLFLEHLIASKNLILSKEICELEAKTLYLRTITK